MRVTFNSYSDSLISQLGKQGNTQAKLQNQISSGQRINQASDDPIAAQRILSLQTSGAQMQQYYTNAGTALDISQASYNSVDGVRKATERASEIAVSSSGVLSASSSAAYASEVDGLVEQSVQSLNSKFNGNYLLGGTKTDTPPFSVARDANGKITGVTYTGASAGASLKVGENNSVSPYTDGNTNQQLGGYVNQLISLRDALASNNTTAAQGMQTTLTQNEDGVLGTLSSLGTMQSRLQSVQDSATADYDTLSNRLSKLNDVDVSTAVVQLTKSQTAYQISVQSASKIMANSLLNYL